MTRFWERLNSAIRGTAAWTQDLVLAIALTAFTQWEISQAPFIEDPIWVQRVTFAVLTMSVALRRVAPLWAAIVGSAALSAQTIWGGDAAVVGGFLAGIIITHSVALYSSRRIAILGLVVILAGVHTYTVVNTDQFRWADEIGNTAIFVTVWGLGRAVRHRQQRSEIAEARTAQVEAERDAHTRAVLAEERAGIARELHDVVAHGVSVMVLQAGAARQTLERDPSQARQPLMAVEASGRQALEDMHRMLGILREEDHDPALEPLVGLDQLDELARQMGEVGLPVSVTLEGEPRPIAPSLDLTAYRIVQEALTNTLKHAGAADAEVIVRYDSAALNLEIRDSGTGTGSPGSSSGQGLVGIRERVSLFNGSMHAGPRGEQDGWTVQARLSTNDGAM
ncbi:MAG: sensor histidine kinase [Acidimicrobiales bacterium]